MPKGNFEVNIDGHGEKDKKHYSIIVSARMGGPDMKYKGLKDKNHLTGTLSE